MEGEASKSVKEKQADLLGKYLEKYVEAKKGDKGKWSEEEQLQLEKEFMEIVNNIASESGLKSDDFQTIEEMLSSAIHTAESEGGEENVWAKIEEGMPAEPAKPDETTEYILQAVESVVSPEATLEDKNGKLDKAIQIIREMMSRRHCKKWGTLKGREATKVKAEINKLLEDDSKPTDVKIYILTEFLMTHKIGRGNHGAPALRLRVLEQLKAITNGQTIPRTPEQPPISPRERNSPPYYSPP